jgi:hypothetical protein
MCSTLRRWRDGNAVEVWEAHKVAVQTVLKLPSGELFTGRVSVLSTHFPFLLGSYSHFSTLVHTYLALC